MNVGIPPHAWRAGHGYCPPNGMQWGGGFGGGLGGGYRGWSGGPSFMMPPSFPPPYSMPQQHQHHNPPQMSNSWHPPYGPPPMPFHGSHRPPPPWGQGMGMQPQFGFNPFMQQFGMPLPPGAGKTTPPGDVRYGFGVAWSGSYTRIHLIEPDPEKFDTKEFLKNLTTTIKLEPPPFSIQMIGTSTPVKDYLTKVCDKKCGWAVTEVIELGDGRWLRGQTIAWENFDLSTFPMEAYGWDKTRGEENRPVWMVLHKS